MEFTVFPVLDKHIFFSHCTNIKKKKRRRTMKSPSTIKYTYIAVFNITNKDYIIIIDAAMRLLPSGSVSIIIVLLI